MFQVLKIVVFKIFTSVQPWQYLAAVYITFRAVLSMTAKVQVTRMLQPGVPHLTSVITVDKSKWLVMSVALFPFCPFWWREVPCFVGCFFYFRMLHFLHKIIDKGEEIWVTASTC
jgi:hypothetical protein